MDIFEAVMSRRSVRRFLDRPVPEETLHRVLEAARWTPSASNCQPWEAAVLTGEPLNDLTRKMLADAKAGISQDPPEYASVPPEMGDRWRARYFSIAQARYDALGIARDDAAGRAAHALENYTAFGAPVLMAIFLPRVMGLAQWADAGMWLQTVMLLLRGEGLDSCAQVSLIRHARTIKAQCGVDDATHVFYCGLSVGWRDPDAAVNGYERDRVPLDEHVRFIGF